MRRLGDERGAVAVLVALLMVPLLGFAAIAIDVGALYVERGQLQNGADAAALAIAQDCAVATPTCASASVTAASVTAAKLADDNANDGHAAAKILNLRSNSVTVQTSTETEDGSTGLAHFFAPILGFDSTEVAATASSVWGAPYSGPAALPITFAHCSFDGRMGVHQVIRYDTNRPRCPGTSLPGGFGWVRHAGSCRVDEVVVGGVLSSEPGNSPSQDCLTNLNKMKADLLLGKQVTVILPVHNEAFGGGGSGTYQTMGFAAFNITGWKFGGGSQWTYNTSCGGNCRGIEGQFVKYVSLDEFKLGGPDLGASIVKMTLEDGS